MEIIGHRGCAEQCPENTVQAVSRAARELDAVEVDIRRCGSGELVVFHDDRVDRLTGGSGLVTELSWADLTSLEVMDSGESIPKLETVLRTVPADVTVQLELKGTGLAADVRDCVRGTETDVAVSSFRPEAIAAVQSLDWDVPTGLLFESAPAANLGLAVDLDCSAVHPHYDLCLETDVVDRAHDRGMDVIAWKAAKTAEEIAAVREAGVDGITADRWDIA